MLLSGSSSETQMMPGEVLLGSSKCPPQAAPGSKELYKVDCIKHLPTLGCTETTDQGPKHSTGENWQTSGAQRLEIRGSNNQLLDSGSDGGGSFHQHSGGARDILSPHRQFMERLASSSTCLLARNCNYYVATWLILDLDWREKCLNNQLVYFNYRKFPRLSIYNGNVMKTIRITFPPALILIEISSPYLMVSTDFADNSK